MKTTTYIIGAMLIGLALLVLGANSQDDGRTYFTAKAFSININGQDYTIDGSGTPFNTDATGVMRLTVPSFVALTSVYSDDVCYWEMSWTDGSAAQNLYETVAGDTGSRAATSPTDTLTLAGASNVTTNMSGGTVTITHTPTRDNMYDNGRSATVDAGVWADTCDGVSPTSHDGNSLVHFFTTFDTPDDASYAMDHNYILNADSFDFANYYDGGSFSEDNGSTINTTWLVGPSGIMVGIDVAGQVFIYDANGNSMLVKTVANLGGDVTYTWPAPSAGFIQDDGSGNLSTGTPVGTIRGRNRYTLIQAAAFSDQYMKLGEVTASGTTGDVAWRAGSITGISFTQTTDLDAPADWDIIVRINGAGVWSHTVADASNEFEFTDTQAAGTDNVAVGDEVSVFIDYVAGANNLDNIVVNVEITED